MSMVTQNYSNHRRYVFMYHVVLFLLTVLTLIGSFVNLWESLGDHQRIYSASLICTLSVCMLMAFFFLRSFALRAQDRAIRAEENLRHYQLTGRLLDGRLGVRQIIGLRFAADGEFPDLAKRAADENLGEEEIKKAIRNWKGDYYRV